MAEEFHTKVHDDDDTLYFLLKKRKRARIVNWRDTMAVDELETKLPNEFKGSIKDYNHHNWDHDLDTDKNTY